MKTDPMVDSGAFEKLMPKPRDHVTLDGQDATFKPIEPKQRGRNGGIALSAGKNTLLAYTVLDIPERKCLKVEAEYTAAARVQVITNSVPVRHKQVLGLQPGWHRVLVAPSMGVYWDRIGPGLGEPDEAEVA